MNGENLGTTATIVIGVLGIILYGIVICSVLVSACERIDAEMQQLVNYIMVGADMENALMRGKPSHRTTDELIEDVTDKIDRVITEDDYGYMTFHNGDQETDVYANGKKIRHEESIDEVE